MMNEVKPWAKQLFNGLVICKQIIHPLRVVPSPEVITQKDLDLLRSWCLARNAVAEFYKDVGMMSGNVWLVVRGSIIVSESIDDAVMDEVLDFIHDDVWDSSRLARAKVGDLYGASVTDAEDAYIGSFFKVAKWRGIEHEKGVYPFQSVVDLWERGLVPSFDGRVWRLHTGLDAHFVWEGQI